MLEKILAKISEGELYGYQKIIKKINILEDNLKLLSDEELANKTIYFRDLIKNGQSLEDILPEAFAVVREASVRVLGLRHYDVQLIGGCILHEGKIAEMKTGEGKTLVAILPAYLNALKDSVHIVTVNEYLAKRDSLFVGKILSFLGLNVGLILEGMDSKTRKKNYICDVIYATNNELGFDYLRDNLATELSERVQKNFNFAIVDEVDSVLIDEARTPLIISRSRETQDSKYLTAKNLAKILVKNIDFEVDKKNRNIFLTEKGTTYTEKLLNVTNLYAFEDPWAVYILNALKAREFYIKDKDYLVNEDSIAIIDEFTGRVLDGRRWSEGLHQAIEAKEDVKIKSESISLASITYQNFFLFYKKLSGMTGTALTEEKEFKKIYNLSVECVPTNKKVQRIDEQDVVYKSSYSKWKAVLEECLNINAKMRPILVGTSSVENSELIADLLDACEVKYSLLNAKPENAAKESEIIAQAGRKGAITIATNMAGRGTDILLGGNPSFLSKSDLKNLLKSGFDNKQKNKFNNKNITELIDKLQYEYEKSEFKIEIVEESIESIDSIIKEKNQIEILLKELYKKIKTFHEEKCNLEKEEVIKVGGLHIIGTERHESRRIDNQLRGRAGRQGDPGSSKFFLSLEDNLLQVFGGENLKNMINQLDLDDDLPIEGKIVNLSIERAQRKIEELNYETRKRLFDYDNVLNIQRRIIYTERNRFLTLNKENIDQLLLQYLEKTVDDIVDEMDRCQNVKNKEQVLESFWKNFVCLPYKIDIENLENMPKAAIKSYLNDQIGVSYELKKLEFDLIDTELRSVFEYKYLLQPIDVIWQEHLSRMTLLKESIGWRSYGQKDPLLEYQRESYKLFLNQLVRIRHNICSSVMGTTSFG